MQPNDVGTDEFLTLCRLLGVDPYITVNAGFGDAWSARELVTYTNGAATTSARKWRAANGHPAPYPVKFWGVGNEPWSDYQMGAVSPLDMGLLAAAHAQEGSLSRAEECIERLHQLAERQYVTPRAESFAAVGMGDFDLALQSLDEAINHKTNFVNLLAIHLIIVPLRILCR